MKTIITIAVAAVLAGSSYAVYAKVQADAEAECADLASSYRGAAYLEKHFPDEPAMWQGRRAETADRFYAQGCDPRRSYVTAQPTESVATPPPIADAKATGYWSDEAIAARAAQRK